MRCRCADLSHGSGSRPAACQSSAVCCPPAACPLPCPSAAALDQVVGFVVLLSGTSVYNEILRACLPAPAPRRSRSRTRTHRGSDAEAGLQQPLLLGEEDLTSVQEQRQRQQGSAPGVRFAPVPPPSRPIGVGRQHADGYTMARCGRRSVLLCGLLATSAGAAGHALGCRLTCVHTLPCPYPYLCRSVTILPAALSPHSLASVPRGSGFGGASFTFRWAVCGAGAAGQLRQAVPPCTVASRLRAPTHSSCVACHATCAMAEGW